MSKAGTAILGILIAPLLGACDLTASQERATAARADDGVCTSYALKLGSPEYAQCRISKDQQRQNHEAALVNQVIRNNQRASDSLTLAPIPKPSVNCTTTSFGGGM